VLEGESGKVNQSENGFSTSQKMREKKTRRQAIRDINRKAGKKRGKRENATVLGLTAKQGKGN